MIVTTVCATKGGVGKTSLCANIGGLVSDMGWNVLLIDADPQASLTNYFPISSRANFGLRRILSHGDAEQSISKTNLPRLDIVTCDGQDNPLEKGFLSVANLCNQFRTALINLHRYDLILVDTQGCSSIMLDSAIPMSNILLSPIVPDLLSAREFFNGTIHTIERLKESFGEIYSPTVTNVIIYRTRHTKDSHTISKLVRTQVTELPHINLLATHVPDRTVYRDAASAQIPVHHFEQKRRNGMSAAETIHCVVSELFPSLTHRSPVDQSTKNNGGNYAKTSYGKRTAPTADESVK